VTGRASGKAVRCAGPARQLPLARVGPARTPLSLPAAANVNALARSRHTCPLDRLDRWGAGGRDGRAGHRTALGRSRRGRWASRGPRPLSHWDSRPRRDRRHTATVCGRPELQHLGQGWRQHYRASVLGASTRDHLRIRAKIGKASSRSVSPANPAGPSRSLRCLPDFLPIMNAYDESYACKQFLETWRMDRLFGARVVPLYAP
jgi:hypothetical protein